MIDPIQKSAALILLERHGINAVSFRRYIRSIQIVETRSWEDCEKELDSRPGSVVCLAASRADWLTAVKRISRIQFKFLRTFTIVAIDRNEFASAEKQISDVIMECGCGFVVDSPFRIRDAAELASRHIKRLPKPDASITEQIWQRMPWQPVS